MLLRDSTIMSSAYNTEDHERMAKLKKTKNSLMLYNHFQCHTRDHQRKPNANS